MIRYLVWNFKGTPVWVYIIMPHHYDQATKTNKSIDIPKYEDIYIQGIMDASPHVIMHNLDFTTVIVLNKFHAVVTYLVEAKWRIYASLILAITGSDNGL